MLMFTTKWHLLIHCQMTSMRAWWQASLSRIRKKPKFLLGDYGTYSLSGSWNMRPYQLHYPGFSARSDSVRTAPDLQAPPPHTHYTSISDPIPGISSLPHGSTTNSKGQHVPSVIHITIRCGNSPPTFHVTVYTHRTRRIGIPRHITEYRKFRGLVGDYMKTKGIRQKTDVGKGEWKEIIADVKAFPALKAYQKNWDKREDTALDLIMRDVGKKLRETEARNQEGKIYRAVY